MGVKDLSKELRQSDKLTSHLSTFSGKVVGLDASIWLNKALFSSPEITALFHQLPKVSIAHLIRKYFDVLHSVFEANDITILFVLDGARNPLKALTNQIRQKSNSDACLEMQNLIELGDQNNLKKIATVKKRGLYVREDVLADFVEWCNGKKIRYVCAFMEAEWELCRLERDGIIDAVAPEDSDCYVLGCLNMIQLLDIRVSPTGPNCTITSGNTWTEYVKNILPDATLGEMADFAVLLGVDYLDRAYGNSVAKVKGFFPNWRSEKDEILSQIKNNGQVKGKRSRAGIPGYSKTFRESANIFQYAPCFIVDAALPGETVRESFWNNTFLLRRGNLRQIPVGVAEVDLFGFDPEVILPEGHDIKDLFTMKIWIRSSCSVLNFVVPFPRNDKDEILPWGCNLDFEIVPVSMQPTQALVVFLECRGLSPRASNTRAQLVSAVERVVSQGSGGPAILPCTDIAGSGHYVNLEVLTCNEPILWLEDGADQLRLIQQLRTPLDEEFLKEYFGVGRNGVRERAWGRINGGHFDMKTMRSAVCKCRTTSGIDPVRIFSIKCTPSMKKDAYTIYLVFRTSNDKFVPPPASRCNCPVGRLFCSHMLAYIVLLGMMQSLRETETYEWFESNMPDPVKSLHSLCIPFQYVF